MKVAEIVTELQKLGERHTDDQVWIWDNKKESWFFARVGLLGGPNGTIVAVYPEYQKKEMESGR